MKVLITGAQGQLGRALQATLPAGIHIDAYDRERLDITSAAKISERLAHSAPDVVVNAAAYTKVDLAETEPDRAHSVNATGASNLALAARALGAKLIHVSTDFVFDGVSERPYRPDEVTRPLNVYGQTKRAGETVVLETLPERSLVVRTSGLYDVSGVNFVKTMLRLFAEAPEVRVVDDQVGSPTWAPNLARAVWAWVELPKARGIRHWTDRGQVSWFDFASAIREQGIEIGLLSNPAPLVAVSTAEFPTAAERPLHSVLECSASTQELGLEQVDWRDSLDAMLVQLKNRLAKQHQAQVPAGG